MSDSCLCHFFVNYLYFNQVLVSGDVEFKQNKNLPVEKQVVTANPDITSVCNSTSKMKLHKCP